MGSGGGAQSTGTAKPAYFKREGREAAEGLSYLSGTAGDRLQGFNQNFGLGATLGGQSRGEFAKQFGLSGDQLTGAIQTGGIAPFSADTQASFAAARGFNGPNMGGALGDLGKIDFGGIGGDVNSLRKFQVNQGVGQDINSLRNFQVDPSVGQGIDTLQGFQGSQEARDALGRVTDFDALSPSQAQSFLVDSASGRYLQEENPYLGDFIKASQRRLTNSFNEDILPGIGAQFGASGAFNNSMRVPLTTQAARDLEEQLGDIDTRMSFDVYNAERGFMENARGRLNDSEIARSGQNLSALQSGLSGAVDLSAQQLSAQQAALQGGLQSSQIRQSGLAEALQGGLQSDQLRQSALNSALQGSLGLGGLQLGSAQTRADIANAQAQGELQRIGLLGQIGAKQDSLASALALVPQNRQDARFNELSEFSRLLNPGAAGSAAPRSNRVAGAAGGAMTGAAAGATFGPYGAVAGGLIGGAAGYFA